MKEVPPERQTQGQRKLDEKSTLDGCSLLGTKHCLMQGQPYQRVDTISCKRLWTAAQGIYMARRRNMFCHSHWCK